MIPVGLPSTIVDISCSNWNQPIVMALSSDGTVWTWVRRVVTCGSHTQGSTTHAAATYGAIGRDVSPVGLSTFIPGQVQATFGVSTPFIGESQCCQT